MNLKKLSTDSYKGVRDFYPEEMAVQNYIFDVWKKVVESFGYRQYNASVLEPAELYAAKSGDEIVNEQTYTFKDRGDRNVTLRPEMTPTVARMVAAKKRELGFPLRWYSIPNLFRYEQPQRGRLREHWQLNVDIFGVENINADVEIIQIAYSIMTAFGLKDTDFEIRLNNRKIINYILHLYSLPEENVRKIAKLIDKKAKIPKKTFEEGIEELFGSDAGSCTTFLTLLNSKNLEEFTHNLNQTKEEHEGLREVKELTKKLEQLGVTNVVFDQTLMRGFDYYTGIIFEVFDKNPENRRSVFGGGRYDDLLSLFGGEKVPAFGFGAGDVIMKELLETYHLLPKTASTTDICVVPTDETSVDYANEVAQTLRQHGKKVAVDYTKRKVGDKIKAADKMGIPDIIVIGEDEVKTGKYIIKNLATGNHHE